MTLINARPLWPLETKSRFQRAAAAAMRGAAVGLRILVRIARAYVRHRGAMRQLVGLDPHQLADLGLTTGDVEAAVAEPLWRDPTARLAVLREERRAAGPSGRDEGRGPP